MKLKTYKPHPAAQLFPMMTEAELDALAADIKENGQHEPIILMGDGRLLDGRNRLEACHRAKVEPEVELWGREDDGISPTAWVISKNLRRRHLNESQSALVAVDALPLFAAEAKSRQRAAGGDRRSVSAPGREAVLAWKSLGGGAWDGHTDGGHWYGVRKQGQKFYASTPERGTWKTGPHETADGAKLACEAEARRAMAADGRASTAAATAVGIGSRTVERAKAVIASAPAAEVEKIRSGEKTLKQVERETKRAKQVREIRAYVPPEGEWEVISSDPPWKFDDALDGSDAIRGGCGYPPMELDEICALKIPAAKDCVLWLWTTNTHLANGAAAEVVRRWGFHAKTIFTWNKVHYGAGHWLRNVTEHCILATRGKPVVLGQNTSTLSPPWPRSSTHSEKPAAFYAMVQEICPARSRLEMFARVEKREGWDITGAEVPKAKGQPFRPPAPVEPDLPEPPPPEAPKPARPRKGWLKIKDEEAA